MAKAMRLVVIGRYQDGVLSFFVEFVIGDLLSTFIHKIAPRRLEPLRATETPQLSRYKTRYARIEYSPDFDRGPSHFLRMMRGGENFCRDSRSGYFCLVNLALEILNYCEGRGEDDIEASSTSHRSSKSLRSNRSDAEE